MGRAAAALPQDRGRQRAAARAVELRARLHLDDGAAAQLIIPRSDVQPRLLGSRQERFDRDDDQIISFNTGYISTIYNLFRLD